MKNIKFIIPILSLIFLVSCKDDDRTDDPNTVDYTQIDIVTGVDFFDANASPVGRWGFPNHRPSDVIVYPIPNNGTIFMGSMIKVKRVWLVPAECFKDSVTMNITTLTEDVNYEVSELEAVQIKDIPTPDFMDQQAFDFTDVASGFYKMFYQMESDEIFWYNMYIDPSATNFPDFNFMENECN